MRYAIANAPYSAKAGGQKVFLFCPPENAEKNGWTAMKFEWHPIKADINLKKHGVTFSEAQTVFDDPLACIFDDEWNSVGEQRELIIGYSSKKQLLIISFTERLPGIIRIISARQTTARERKNHENYRRY